MPWRFCAETSPASDGALGQFLVAKHRQLVRQHDVEFGTKHFHNYGPKTGAAPRDSRHQWVKEWPALQPRAARRKAASSRLRYTAPKLMCRSGQAAPGNANELPKPKQADKNSRSPCGLGCAASRSFHSRTRTSKAVDTEPAVRQDQSNFPGL